MKKIIIAFLLTLIVFLPINNVSALENKSYTFEYEKNGNYYETSITYDTPLARAASSVNGHKTITCKSSSGKILWSVTVNGTFTYNGSSSTCTSASVSTSVSDGNWKIASKSSSKSGNTAKATATAHYYLNGNIIDRQTKTVTLKCSASGKLN